MRVYAIVLAVAVLGAACGEDKNYGDPLTDPNAGPQATAAVANARQLSADTTNDTALDALNGVSGNYNILGGIKYQAGQSQAGPGPRPPLAVDAACVVQTETDITYANCDYAGNTVNGSVTRSGADVHVDVDFVRVDTDQTTTIRADGTVTLTETAVTGALDFDVIYEGQGYKITSQLDGDFDVVLDGQGCAIDGQLEVHAHASAAGQSQSVWVLAEFGPTCGDVVVR